MDPWGSHIPVLMAAASHTKGAVIELGCGDYSTPALHLVCKGRMLVSAEEDSGWLSRFCDLADDTHKLFYVENNNWEGFAPIDWTWDVAFVDHAPVGRRKVDIARLRDKTRFVVIHDTECPAYEYEPVLATFRYRVDYKRGGPWTSVVSNLEPISFLG